MTGKAFRGQCLFMAKPDTALLDPARYPHHLETLPRFGDLDPFQHVNNVAMARLFEDARARFNRASGFTARPPKEGMLVASMTIDYLGEATYPQALQICSAATQIGRTSLVMIQLALQDGTPVALSRTVMVQIREGKAAPLTEQRLAQLQDWMLRP